MNTSVEIRPVLLSMMFVPGSEESKLDRIPHLPGSALILDLEDSVAVSEKPEARKLVRAAIERHGAETNLWVRVNPAGTGMLSDDVEAVAVPGLAGIDLPKVESAQQVRDLEAMLDRLEEERGIPSGAIEVMATIETAAGVAEADAIAATGKRLRCLGFGTGDFCLDIGIDVDPASPSVIAAKVAVVFASRRAGLEAPHDSVYVDYQDPEGLRADTEAGKRLGFYGKHAIHPAQIPVIEEVLAPTAEQIDRARRLLESFEAAVDSGKAAIGFEGTLIDYPLATRARQILALAEQLGAREG